MNDSSVAYFPKGRAGPFHDLSAGRSEALVEALYERFFGANEAFVHPGAEAAHFDVVLSGAVHRSALGDRRNPRFHQQKSHRLARRTTSEVNRR
jgi:hypothetical protein